MQVYNPHFVHSDGKYAGAENYSSQDEYVDFFAPSIGIAKSSTEKLPQHDTSEVEVNIVLSDQVSLCSSPLLALIEDNRDLFKNLE